MGNFIPRSSSSRAERSGKKLKRGKRDRLQPIETAFEADQYPDETRGVRKMSDSNTLETFTRWNQRGDQQNPAMMNGDPPGAPSTFSNNHPRFAEESMNQGWSAPQNSTNSFYQSNPPTMSAALNVSYDPNQYGQSMMPAIFINQLAHGATDERTSKKVQFANAPSHQASQQTAISRNALASTQSWHEPSANARDTLPARRPDAGLNSQLLNQSVVALALPSSFQASASVPKPIYLGIDHEATLAERGQTVVHKRLRKNGDRTNAEAPSSTSRRARPHVHHQTRSLLASDSSNTKIHVHGNRSLEPLQAKLSGPQRTGITTTAIIHPNRLITPLENMDHEYRPNKTRSSRQQFEQQSLVNNEQPTSRTNRNQPQLRQQQRSNALRNNSPLRTETNATVRRGENRAPDTPVMRIPIPLQQRQRQRPPGASTPTNVTRTRV